ncbi:4-hydroxybenzoate 3-monooxygenase [Roseovarius salinarum]|uniref:4-hydroxybenzoate 3-monooxygenase n=1 Tax=Roseovarius salinarum TaxID=1981892 RepID=UPI000C3268F9|nr:4-hydroxybenzoate 3-monooxygenase [Roseovarius salinarum]
MRTQVAIIGGGPAGLLLAQLLHNQGIETCVLERTTREEVLGRVRAGVLETGFTELLAQAGADAGLKAGAGRHAGLTIADGENTFRVDLEALTGKTVAIYGQSDITRDLYAVRDAAGAPTLHECAGVKLHDLDGDTPFVTFLHGGKMNRLDFDFVIGCDGFRGPTRQEIPEDARVEHEKIYPFGWLGILTETPPVTDEFMYCRSDRGFALCAMQHDGLSRYYLQCRLSDGVDDWTDEMFWAELSRRIPSDVAGRLEIGPSLSKYIAPLRSQVCSPMRYGKLFLCGDAAHIVPPTGAKGLNTAASDIHYLHEALSAWYGKGDADALEAYSDRALARIWKTQRFSWWMTQLLHRFPEQSGFDRHLQDSEMDYLRDSTAAQTTLAENYVGLPY